MPNAIPMPNYPDSASPLREMRYFTGKENQQKEPNMTILEIEAETLDEAIQLAKSKVPRDKIILALKILEDGQQPGRQNFFAHNEEDNQKEIDAYSQKHQRKIIDQKQIRERRVEKKTVEVKSDVDAYSVLHDELSAIEGTDIGQLKCIEPAHKGFLGIGKSAARYEAYVVFRTVIEATFEPKARVKVMFGEVEEIKRYLLNII